MIHPFITALLLLVPVGLMVEVMPPVPAADWLAAKADGILLPPVIPVHKQPAERIPAIIGDQSKERLTGGKTELSD